MLNTGETYMSQAQVQTQTQTQYFIEVIEVLYKYNIMSDAIADVLNRVMLYNKHGLHGHIMTYMHSTWGSCREWKLVVVDRNNNYLPGEWINESSRKNIHKYKYTPIEQMPEEFIVYYYASPSCNQARQFSFRVVARLVKQ